MPGTRVVEMSADTKSVRQMLWRSMRIMTTFTISGLMRTIPEGTPIKYENVQEFVTQLVKSNYVSDDGVCKGKQSYRLVNNIGPIMPGVDTIKGIGIDAAHSGEK